jgi:nitrogen fixation protein NifU and related proteins
MSDLYQEIILEQLNQPQRQGKIENPDATHRERNSSCGDEVTIYLQVNKNEKPVSQRQILDLKWQGHGCAISNASISLLAQEIIDQQLTLGQVMAIKPDTLLELLGLDEISPGRVKCLELGLKAIQRAGQKVK